MLALFMLVSAQHGLSDEPPMLATPPATYFSPPSVWPFNSGSGVGMPSQNPVGIAPSALPLMPNDLSPELIQQLTPQQPGQLPLPDPAAMPQMDPSALGQQVPGAPGMPGMPGMQSMPGMPAIPDVPGMPSMPGMPQAAALPQLPSGGDSSLTQEDVPSMPELTGPSMQFLASLTTLAPWSSADLQQMPSAAGKPPMSLVSSSTGVEQQVSAIPQMPENGVSEMPAMPHLPGMDAQVPAELPPGMVPGMAASTNFASPPTVSPTVSLAGLPSLTQDLPGVPMPAVGQPGMPLMNVAGTTPFPTMPPLPDIMDKGPSGNPVIDRQKAEALIAQNNQLLSQYSTWLTTAAPLGAELGVSALPANLENGLSSILNVPVMPPSAPLLPPESFSADQLPSLAQFDTAAQQAAQQAPALRRAGGGALPQQRGWKALRRPQMAGLQTGVGAGAQAQAQAQATAQAAYKAAAEASSKTQATSQYAAAASQMSNWAAQYQAYQQKYAKQLERYSGYAQQQENAEQDRIKKLRAAGVAPPALRQEDSPSTIQEDKKAHVFMQQQQQALQQQQAQLQMQLQAFRRQQVETGAALVQTGARDRSRTHHTLSVEAESLAQERSSLHLEEQQVHLAEQADLKKKAQLDARSASLINKQKQLAMLQKQLVSEQKQIWKVLRPVKHDQPLKPEVLGAVKKPVVPSPLRQTMPMVSASVADASGGFWRAQALPAETAPPSHAKAVVTLETSALEPLSQSSPSKTVQKRIINLRSSSLQPLIPPKPEASDEDAAPEPAHKPATHGASLAQVGNAMSSLLHQPVAGRDALLGGAVVPGYSSSSSLAQTAAASSADTKAATDAALAAQRAASTAEASTTAGSDLHVVAAAGAAAAQADDEDSPRVLAASDADEDSGKALSSKAASTTEDSLATSVQNMKGADADNDDLEQILLQQSSTLRRSDDAVELSH